MRGPLAFIALVLAFAAGGYLGWWAVPATAALWGALLPSVKRPALTAALAATLAWAGWLAADGISGHGAFGVLTGRLAQLMGLPAVALMAITLALAAVLAWSAAAVAGALGERLRRQHSKVTHS